MNTTSTELKYDESTAVLIVGGGLIGLSTSLFLSWQGISSIMVERHPGTAIHPRAMGLAPRTMELFRTVGAEEAIREVEPPFSRDGNVLLVESLMGQEFDCLQEDVISLFINPASPVHGSAVAQDVLEPVLRAKAAALGGDLRFGTELVTFEQNEQGVTTTVRDRTSGQIRTIRSQFLVAADGSQSPIRQQLGIVQHGVDSMGQFISIIFEADLMKMFRERQAIMCFLSNETIAGGALVPYPGSSVRPDLFRLDVGYDPETETVADYTEERCLELIRAAVGIPDFQVHRVKAVLTWEMHALVADQFQQGRIFLVGDAARTQPPSGGLGGNTGIAEAQNLAWKLACVLRGEAGQGLLATYDVERRPLADYTAEQVALLSAQRQTEGSKGITVDPVILNMGYRYNAGAFVLEEGATQLPLAQNPARWTGQPGTHVPNIRFERKGASISLLDLVNSHFVLLIGPEEQSWEEAANHAKEALHLPLDVYQIGTGTRNLVDVDNTFGAAFGIGPGGAVLVRPDGFIAWRSLTAKEQAQEAEQTLTQALSTLLYR